ncbi:MAG: hypothetical protein KC503_20110 [Myxococcales bacterium]|nr:hypothetical protein [Myxococcales bacterium]
MGRALLAAIAVALAASSGCWADFPENLLHDDGGVTESGTPDITIDGALGDLDGQPPPPDLPAGDTTVDSGPSDISCTPGEFLGCVSGNAFLRCASSGKATRRIDCGSASCSASARRCDQCTPGAPPTCGAGGERRTCTPDGLFVDMPCASGCAAGVCCKDDDNDGAGCNDCDDGDPRAKPGQMGWFDTPRNTAGGFDFNCDNNDELEIKNTYNCQKQGAGCIGAGWAAIVPACGDTAQFIDCNRAGGVCVPAVGQPRRQRCR